MPASKEVSAKVELMSHRELLSKLMEPFGVSIEKIKGKWSV
jgi:hypothetical protein